MKYLILPALILFSLSAYSQTRNNLNKSEEMNEFIQNARMAFDALESELHVPKTRPIPSDRKINLNSFDRDYTASEDQINDVSTSNGAEKEKESINKKLKSNSVDYVFEVMSPDNGLAIMALASDGKSSFNGAVEVDGASTNKVAYDAGESLVIDFTKSNLAYTSHIPGEFVLNGIKDGGTYTLAVQSTTAGLASFTSYGFTFKSKNNGTTLQGTESLYTFLVMGSKVYYSVTTGL